MITKQQVKNNRKKEIKPVFKSVYINITNSRLFKNFLGNNDKKDFMENPPATMIIT